MKLTPEILHQATTPATFDKPMANMSLAKRMIKLMHREKGRGLAANQIGVNKRMFVMRLGDEDIACWNPEITKSSDDTVQFDEGCLSFPGDWCKITRPDTVEVLYYNCVGKEIRRTLTGINSRCFQHELDHLNGITMWDRYKEQHAE